jgi:hypothetical protein
MSPPAYIGIYLDLTCNGVCVDKHYEWEFPDSMQVSKLYFGDQSKELKMVWVCTSGRREVTRIEFTCGTLFGNQVR